MRRLVVIIIFLVVARPAAAQRNTVQYTVFDLASGTIVVSGMPPNATVPSLPGLAKCDVTVASGVLTFKRNTDATCMAVFDTNAPGALTFDVLVPGTPPPAPKRGCRKCAKVPDLHATYVLAFDRGVQPIAKAEVADARRRVELHGKPPISGELVYYSSPKKTWIKVGLKSGVATIDKPDSIAEGTATYFRPDKRTEVIEVSLEPPPPPSGPINVDKFNTTCEPEVEAARKDGGWYATLDAKSGNTLVVTKPPRIVEPNVFGRVIVRHSSQFAAKFTANGTIGLHEPKIREGDGQAGSAVVLDGTRASRRPPKLVCTDYDVAPRKPGAYTITVELVDPAGEAGKNTVSSQPLDIVVLERYAGAFRAGVAALFGPVDQQFASRTMPGSTQAEIVRSSRTPFELVLGYSHFLGAPRGRSYFSHSGAPVQDSRWGLFLGFGAVSFNGDDFDFLKSLHLGVEFEITQNLAIAVTGVVRRVDELTDGARVGSPVVGSSIPTETRYAAGGAIVLNISPKFFSFAANIRK